MSNATATSNETSSTSLGGLVGEDAELMASALVNLQMLGYMVVAYLVLHFFFAEQFYHNPLKRGRGPTALSRAWHFVPLVLRMSDDDIEQYAGLDALALLEFIWLVLKILASYSAYGLVVSLLASWASAEYGEGAWEGPEGGLARISVANMRPFRSDNIFTESWDRWLPSIASVVGILLLTGVTIRLLFRSWEKIVVRRSSLLANASDYSALTVLVRTAGHLAKKPTTAAEARALWGLLYPGQIFDVRMVRDTGPLPKQLAQRKKLTAAIEALEAKIAKAEAKKQEKQEKQGAEAAATGAEEAGVTAEGGGEQGEVQKGGFGLCATPQAKLQAARAKRAALDEKLRAAAHTASAEENDHGFNYFVCFNSHRACNLAKQVVNTPDANFKVVAAPLLEDVRWASLVPAAQRRQAASASGANVAYYAMLAFYAIPVRARARVGARVRAGARVPHPEP